MPGERPRRRRLWVLEAEVAAETEAAVLRELLEGIDVVVMADVGISGEKICGREEEEDVEAALTSPTPGRRPNARASGWLLSWSLLLSSRIRKSQRRSEKMSLPP